MFNSYVKLPQATVPSQQLCSVANRSRLPIGVHRESDATVFLRAYAQPQNWGQRYNQACHGPYKETKPSLVLQIEPQWINSLMYT